MRRPQSSTRSQAPRARRRFGQNFLVDPRAVARAADAIAAPAGTTVVEIGPGRGALTEVLLARGVRVVAIEIDRDLAADLRSRHPDPPLAIVEADVLSVSLESFGRDLVVAGNLPYNISKPVAMKLVEERAWVARAVLMFQREVADRLTASPGTAAYGPLTVLAGRCFAIDRLFDLPPGAFRPQPEVVSTLTRWTRIPDPPVPLPALKALLRAAFARRRQTLLKNLRAGLPASAAQAEAWLESAGVPTTARAETIPPEGFVALAAAIAAAKL